MFKTLEVKILLEEEDRLNPYPVFPLVFTELEEKLLLEEEDESIPLAKSPLVFTELEESELLLKKSSKARTQGIPRC